MKKSWLIGGAVIIVAVFAWLLFGGLEKNVVFFLRKSSWQRGRTASACPCGLAVR